MQVCEGSLSDEQIAQSTIKSLHKEISYHGEEPLRYIEHIAEMIESFATQPILKTALDWLELDNEIERLAQCLPVAPAAADAAEKACEQIRHEVWAGKLRGDLSEIKAALCERYQLNLYRSCFEGKVQLLETHYRDADHDRVEEKLATIHPLLIEGIRSQARKIAQTGTSLPKVRAAKVKMERRVDADTEIPLPA
jgi:hypothetical protein